MTTLPLYTIKTETQDGRRGYRICLNFRGQLLPIPNLWYGTFEVATLRIMKMQKEDYELWQRSSLAPPTREYDGEGNPL